MLKLVILTILTMPSSFGLRVVGRVGSELVVGKRVNRGDAQW